MAEYSFKNLEVWRLGMNLVKKVYNISSSFPESEKFVLQSQIKRAVISIPLNIAEGSGRRSKKEFASFTQIAIGSLLEVVTCLDIANELNYISDQQNKDIQEETKKLYFKLIGLRNSMRNQ